MLARQNYPSFNIISFPFYIPLLSSDKNDFITIYVLTISKLIYYFTANFYDIF